MRKANSGWMRGRAAVLLSAALVLAPFAATPAMAAEGGDVSNAGSTVEKNVAVDESTIATVTSSDGSLTGSYDTLAEAITNVPDGGTVTLLKDATGSGVQVLSGTNFTLDLGGFTYTVTNPTVGSTGTETNGFQLLKDSTIKFKNGAITASTSSAQILIQNYSNLTLEGVTLDGGTSTQYTAVRKAFLPGVVPCRPYVWNIYAAARKTPSTAPCQR